MPGPSDGNARMKISPQHDSGMDGESFALISYTVFSRHCSSDIASLRSGPTSVLSAESVARTLSYLQV